WLSGFSQPCNSGMTLSVAHGISPWATLLFAPDLPYGTRSTPVHSAHPESELEHYDRRSIQPETYLTRSHDGCFSITGDRKTAPPPTRHPGDPPGSRTPGDRQRTRGAHLLRIRA